MLYHSKTEKLERNRDVAAKTTSVSVTAIIPFNLSELLSIFASHIPTPATSRHRAMKTGARASADPINVVTLMDQSDKHDT